MLYMHIKAPEHKTANRI